ncbi:hypothetical protein JAAARDRAFT_79353 [Jaapia argillacea MUCL 33604]|uniref:FAD-binding domain-containing protein n=1 Tax=Jaapia argillacea MUCL 33604 TaxID=933084 RepID=A0A067PYF0_9AGAM|nr:hypothetical protein JAAARDRAFT_79353 [Jaapia argillacea MUCL 33604]
MSSSSPPVRVAICGGGIGGLALAVTLGKYSTIPVDIYEAASELTTIGAGISVWRRTWRIMQLLGLDIELAKKAIQPPKEEPRPGFIFRKSDQIDGHEFFRMMAPYGSITLHRADLVDVLKSSLPPSCKIHVSKRLASYTQSSSSTIMLHFEDGTTAESDVLVGADGIHSPTRTSMFRPMVEKVTDPDQRSDFRQKIEPKWTGTVLYRALIPTHTFFAKYPEHESALKPMIYVGKDKHFISYPISHGRFVNVAAFVNIPNGEGTMFEGKWVSDVPRQEVVDHFVGWEHEVRALVDCMDDPSRWVIHVMGSLPAYATERVALIGDAAHAMHTHLGAGAGQAIEDAYILGRLLSNVPTSPSNIHDALKVYETIRLPFANELVWKTRATGLMYEFNDSWQVEAWNERESVGEAELKELSRKIYGQWEWHWTTRFDDDLERALLLLGDATTDIDVC